MSVYFMGRAGAWFYASAGLILLLAILPSHARADAGPTPPPLPLANDRSPAAAEHSSVPDPENLFSEFHIRATAAGQMEVPEFLAFLESAPAKDGPEEGLLTHGLMLGVLGILAGGFLLNLTPCVLPMIPINLAIIGAGARAASRRSGFLLGGAYGLAMALVYGALGLAVVLTGATFGALNASPIFNGVMAALFLVFAMGMFGLLPIDLSRFQSGLKTRNVRGRFPLAFLMGGVSALLAGACVAPVLISVLLLSAEMYGRGMALGLGLPFLLGLGMGLPWPFAGAGLSFLPHPGRWMNLVKYAFGVLILITALYYGRLAWRLSHPPPPESPAGAEAFTDSGIFRLSAASTTEDWEGVLDFSRSTGKPVFLDFWATWCRVCLIMQRTTFQDEAVVEKFRDFVFVKYQAEQPNTSPTREILAHFGIMGLPTYLILDPP